MSSKCRRKQCQPRRVVRESQDEVDAPSLSGDTCSSSDQDKVDEVLHEEQDSAMGNVTARERETPNESTDFFSYSKDPWSSSSVHSNGETSSSGVYGEVTSPMAQTASFSSSESLQGHQRLIGSEYLSHGTGFFTSSPLVNFVAGQELLHKAAISGLPPQGGFPCFHCNQVFSQQKECELHFQKCHNLNGTYSSDEKNASPTGSGTDEKEVQFECIDCRRAFSNKGNFIQHMKTHVPQEKEFPCPFCNKMFSNDCNRKIHLRAHTGEKPFKCEICGRGFSHKHNMRVHLRTHTHEKPYQCPDCDKAFAHVSALKIHARIHTGEKPYKCDVCGKPFSHSSTLSMHRRMHTGEKPFQCAICYKTFARDCILKNHLKTHTGFEFSQVDTNVCSD